MRVFLSAVVLVVLMLASVSFAQTVGVRATWEAPTEGSPVVQYILELSQDGGPYVVYGSTEQTSMDLTLDNLSTYTARVAGQDALGRQGPWSLPSEPYLVDLGVPGAPGQPIILEP